MPKIAFHKCDVITLTWFLGNCTAKNKDIALKFCLHAVCMCFDSIFFRVFEYPENFGLYGQLFLKNQNFEFSGQNRKISKIRDGQMRCQPNFTSFSVYGLLFTSCVHILEACKHLPFLTQNRGT